ncbi:unnamed protein product [Cuscuta epithymum]|uniref:Transposase, Ptta/En/Spm, plant n=1 Tax=Cuscuta epithymum TaxID=186058 RepID=A0AAV0GCF8_9ASTE|nr:unnamed protein product [Cuscuta epithymum]
MSKSKQDMDVEEFEANLETDDEYVARPRRRQKTKKKLLLKKTTDAKVVVKVNKFGVHSGDGWTELANYIGVLTRDTMCILYDDWRKVPEDVKENMWNHILKLFALTPRSRKQVMSTMGVCLRNFRWSLRNDFIFQHQNDLKMLRLPPAEYKHIPTDEWREFVIKSFKAEFKAKSEKGKKMRKKNKYNHRLGSTGYAGLLERLEKELGPDVKQIDRADTWLLGRKKKDGGYDDEVKEIAEKIVSVTDFKVHHALF